MLIPLLAGTVDYGLVLASYARATRAQQAALMAALAGTSGSAIQSAATTAYGSGSPTVSVGTLWYCAPSGESWTHSGTPYTAKPQCEPGYMATQYISVAVSATASLPIALPGQARSYPIRSSTMVRVQ